MSKLQANHEKDHRAFGADEIKDQDKHFVGDPGEPVFQGSWSGSMWFGMAVGHYTLVNGIPTGGAMGDTVFFLPAAYWPPEDIEDICHGVAVGDISFWKVQASDGAVVYNGSGSVTVS